VAYVQRAAKRLTDVFYDLFDTNATHSTDSKGANQRVRVVGVLRGQKKKTLVRSGSQTTDLDV